MIVVLRFASDDLPFEKLKVNVGNSLKTLLTRLRQREEEKAKDRDTKTEEVGKTLSSAMDLLLKLFICMQMMEV